MPHDTGFFLDFGVSLPSPTSGGLFFDLANSVARAGIYSEKGEKFFPKRLLKKIFLFLNDRRLLRLEIKFSHGGPFFIEITTANTAGQSIFWRPDRMSAASADVTIFPRTISKMLFFHVIAAFRTRILNLFRRRTPSPDSRTVLNTKSEQYQ